jgi:hypothetical protein
MLKYNIMFNIVTITSDTENISHTEFKLFSVSIKNKVVPVLN